MIEDHDLMDMAPRIKAMMQTPGWQDYLRIIMDKIATTVDVGFNGDPKDLPYHQGSVDGLKAAVLSGDDVLASVRVLTGEKKEARRLSRASGVSSSFD